MNIVMIISDTLRRDHLPCYGNREIIAPNLQHFSGEALVFEDCYAASFPTIPTRADLMTGRFTFTYLDWGPLPQSEITLAQCLSSAGYLTFGIADTPFVIRNGYGHDRGFDDFHFVRGQKHGPERDDVLLLRKSEADYFAPKTFMGAAEWLERHYAEKFFLYVDTWDPHEPWDPPEYYVKPYLPDYSGEHIDPAYWDWEEYGTSERELEIAHACYCGEISMVDRWFGFLMECLRTLNLLKSTAVLFFSDHGFYFGEHGIFGKRRFRWLDEVSSYDSYGSSKVTREGLIYRSPLHNEITQVPLLMHIPGVSSRRVSGLISLPDLTATILELASADIPKTVQSSSILPLIHGEVESIHDVVVTSAPFEEIGHMSKTVDDLGRRTVEYSPSSITDGEWDLLFTMKEEPIELYRTKEDVNHQNNLADDYPEVVAKLHSKFISFLEEQGTAEDILAPRRGLGD